MVDFRQPLPGFRDTFLFLKEFTLAAFLPGFRTILEISGLPYFFPRININRVQVFLRKSKIRSRMSAAFFKIQRL